MLAHATIVIVCQYINISNYISIKKKIMVMVYKSVTVINITEFYVTYICYYNKKKI